MKKNGPSEPFFLFNLKMFNPVSDGIWALEQNGGRKSLHILKSAQIDCEELYIRDEKKASPTRYSHDTLDTGWKQIAGRTAYAVIFFLIWLMAFFSSRETCAWEMPTSFATSIWVLPS